MKTLLEHPLSPHTLTLPDQFVPQYEESEIAQETHRLLASLSLEQVNELRPTELRVSSANGDSMQYVMFGTNNGVTPTAVFKDADTLAITGGQFGQDYDPGKWLMTEMCRAVAVPNAPLLYFPSPRIGSHSRNLRLTSESLRRVKIGDYTPIIDLRMWAIEDRLSLIGNPDNIFGFGHSMEASIVTQLGEKAANNIGHVILHSSDDPSLVVGRSPKGLKKDFAGGNLNEEMRKLSDAVRHSGIPALTEAQGISTSLGEGILGMRLGMIKDIGGLVLSQYMPINRGLHEGMTRADSLGSLTSLIESGGKAVVTRAELSRVLDEESFSEAISIDGIAGQVIPEYGHEYYDNIILAALANKRALELAT